MERALIILAAGQGSRMQSDLPKVLHKVAGAPMLWHAMRGKDAARSVVVVGHGGDRVEASAKAFDEGVGIARQDEQLGTAHAVAQARAALDGFEGDAIVLYGDTPFIRPETIDAMTEARAAGASVVVLGFEAAEPGGYGRLIMEGDALTRIVEAKEATPEELAVSLCNSGVICAPAPLLFELIDKVGNENAKGEYYLTDIVGLAGEQGLSCAAVRCDEAETMGVNSRLDLAAAEAAFQDQARREAMVNGTTLTDPASVFFAYDTVIGRDVEIGPNVVFGPDVTVESGATILPFCHLEGCHISRGATVGPFARLRPGAELAEDSKVGNFCEVKNAQIDQGAKVNHLTYIGDARVGKKANIGAGTITCNYDGVFKHHTEIGDEAFIGSNSALVAPVTIGAGALVGSGSVITRDVPEGDIALSRARQENKTGMATKLFARLRALKEKK
ncbi:bifunctional UDP-N-acetylglucosamine diphosphorylase/glucosamine-1-phosphate N-acetyltransferase GlmU [Paracoccaceae bacterium GXU_MW_L88]